MELSVDALTVPFDVNNFGSCEKSLDDWNEAYRRVEAYFSALRVENKLLLSSLVFKILGRANDRLESEPDRPVVELAAEETDRLLVEWFRKVLNEPKAEQDDRLSARGRLALLQIESDVPWQQLFLSDAPIPEEFGKKMRRAYLRADPDFRFVEMRPRPIDLGFVNSAVNSASRTLEDFSRRRMVMTVVFWIACATALTLVFFATR